jgi:hypothetical protein
MEFNAKESNAKESNAKESNAKESNAKESNTMNLQMALELLDISLDNIQLTDLTKEYVKKRYRKMALKWHPDKNENSQYATNKFQKIQEAYTYLSKELDIINCHGTNSNTNSNTNEDFVSSKDSKIYIEMLGSFVSSIIKGSYNELFTNIVKEIVINYKSLSVAYLTKLFEKLDKQKAIELYNFMNKYKDILYINSDVLALVSSVIKDKYINDKIFIINPCLKDILEHNIYKLYVDEKLYLVPLWHNEMYFDGVDGTEIIVLCQPKLPDNITIDENNNIYVEMKISIQNELYKIIKEDKFVSCLVGEKMFCIPIDKLLLKEEQIYKFKGQGISQILENDIYNIDYKSDIIVKIFFI